jgi:hypothetical protein
VPMLSKLASHSAAPSWPGLWLEARRPGCPGVERTVHMQVLVEEEAAEALSAHRCVIWRHVVTAFSCLKLHSRHCPGDYRLPCPSALMQRPRPKCPSQQVTCSHTNLTTGATHDFPIVKCSTAEDRASTPAVWTECATAARAWAVQAPLHGPQWRRPQPLTSRPAFLSVAVAVRRRV